VIVTVNGLRETGFAAAVFYVRREMALVALLGAIAIVVVDDLGALRFPESAEARAVTGRVPEAVHQALDALEGECAGGNSGSGLHGRAEKASGLDSGLGCSVCRGVARRRNILWRWRRGWRCGASGLFGAAEKITEEAG
jgi:hypothetical protein